jgi:hypothetical protein
LSSFTLTGNSLGANKALVLDTTAPTAAITYSTTGPYKESTAVTITATFTEAMTTTPKIAISGVSNIAATNMSVGGSTSIWTYAYTAPEGDGTETIALSVGTDAAGNVVTSTPTAGSQFTVDNTAPSLTQITAITTPGNDSTPSYIFTTNEAGTISTNISQGFSTGASASTGSSQTITFNTLPDGTYASKTVTVTDTAGNAGSITIPTFVIETVLPTITNVTSSTANGIFTTGDVISIQVTFAEAVTVTGTPQLTLETGGNDAVVDFASGSGGTDLTFTYTVGANDNNCDLDYSSTTALA